MKNGEDYSMKVYLLNFDVNNYKSIQLCDDVDADYYQMFDGTRLKEHWISPKVKVYDEDEVLLDGDAPGFNIPVFNKNALDFLYPLIHNNVELLPLRLNDELLYGINVITILDAINYDLSDYLTFRDGKRIMCFKKYYFKDEIIKGHNIFKINDIRRGVVFVSECFYKSVIENNLKGFKMELVYENED